MKKFATLIILALVAALFIISDDSKGQSQGNADKLPGGKWTFSAHPYMGPGYDERPVIVTAVMSDLTGTVTTVMLENESAKVVSAVKLEWYLTTDQERATILQQGQTPLIAPSGALAPGKYKELKFPVVSFARVSQPLLKKDTLTGDFRIEIAVAEIQYEDGSSWLAQKAQPSSANRSAHAKRVAQCPAKDASF